MAKRVLRVQLNKQSIQDALDYIEAYQKSIEDKMNILTMELSKIGVEVINATMMGVSPADRGEYEVKESISKGKNSTTMTITLSGDQVLFIEYSAGVTFGTTDFSPLPNNPDYGSDMGVGTYPDQTHAYDPTGWWYKDKYGTSQHTYGISAHAPMYHADMEMRAKIVSIAKEVFNDG